MRQARRNPWRKRYLTRKVTRTRSCASQCQGRGWLQNPPRSKPMARRKQMECRRAMASRNQSLECSDLFTDFDFSRVWFLHCKAHRKTMWSKDYVPINWHTQLFHDVNLCEKPISIDVWSNEMTGALLKKKNIGHFVSKQCADIVLRWCYRENLFQECNALDLNPERKDGYFLYQKCKTWFQFESNIKIERGVGLWILHVFTV